MAEKKTLRGKYGAYASDPAGGYYDELARELLDEYLSYGDFVYDPESDPLYLAYRDSYTRKGNEAMLDAYALASAMTGGYGNSYAAAAGAGAYADQLDKLDDRLAELYQASYKRYNDGLDAAYRRYKTADEYYDSLLDRYYADRKFRYQAKTDAANAQYKRERDAAEDAYKRERDAESYRYKRERDAANDRYRRERDAENDRYRRERDTVGDSQWERRYLLDLQKLLAGRKP